MKAFFKVFLIVMAIFNVLAGFLLGEMLNVALGTIFLIMAIVYMKKMK